MPLSRGLPKQFSKVLMEESNNFFHYWYRWFQDLFTFIDTKTPEISTGTSAPTSTPRKVGDIFVDTSTPNVYIAKGTTSSADWKLV